MSEIRRAPLVSPPSVLGALFLVSGAGASPLAGQSTAAEPATAEGAPLPLTQIEELRDLLDLLHLRTGAAPPPIEVRGTRIGDIARLATPVTTAPPSNSPGAMVLFAAWADRLGGGAVPRPDGDGSFSYAAVLEGGGRWGHDLLLDRGTGLFTGLTARAAITDRFGLALEVVEGGWSETEGVRELLATARVAGAIVAVGRTRPRLGAGADDLLLSGTQPLDGVDLSTAEPFRLPGFLGRVGAISVSTSIRALEETGAVEDPWYGSVAFSIDPVASVRVGASRTAAFGGEGRPAVTPGRILRLLAGMHSTDVGEFEDQYAQLFARVRLAPAGHPFLLYGSLAMNDTQAAIRDDPGLLAGLLFPLAPPAWLGTLRLEYTAFGKGARWCFWCEGGRPRTWFNHYVFGAHAVNGLPIGSTLGGYGARHLVRWRGWDGGATWSLGADLFRERRDATNLLEDRWPGARWGGTASVGYRVRPGTIVNARAGLVRDAEGEMGGSAEIGVSWVFVRG